MITAYVQRQKALLDRIKQDVDKLESFKQSVDTDCEEAFSRILLNEATSSAEPNDADEGDKTAEFEGLGALTNDVNGSRDAGIIGALDWEAFRNGGECTNQLPTYQRSEFKPHQIHLS